jgi:uncharacterized DUF497 family protein
MIRSVEFHWDAKKAKYNLSKHRVAFDEAVSVFGDTLAAIFDDEAHSLEERRELIIGHSSRGRLLLVCFTETEKGCVRLFSARAATRKERKDYEEGKEIQKS